MLIVAQSYMQSTDAFVLMYSDEIQFICGKK